MLHSGDTFPVTVHTAAAISRSPVTLAHRGGAGMNADGSGVPTWGESTSTISARMGLRLFRSSSCSAFPTLKESRVATRSSMKASHSPLVTPMLVCDFFMLSPV